MNMNIFLNTKSQLRDTGKIETGRQIYTVDRFAVPQENRPLSGKCIYKVFASSLMLKFTGFVRSVLLMRYRKKIDGSRHSGHTLFSHLHLL